MDDIDTTNKYMVGMLGDGVTIMFPPRGRMTTNEALNLAAYLVLLSGSDSARFMEVLEAVQRS